MTGAGKSTLLAQLCGEGIDDILPTAGFSIKAIPLQNVILNVKELGGGDAIRKYWSRYYQGSQGLIFVLDSASMEDDLEVARSELHAALHHPQLCTLPFLILASHQDKLGARSQQEGLEADTLPSWWCLRKTESKVADGWQKAHKKCSDRLAGCQTSEQHAANRRRER